MTESALVTRVCYAEVTRRTMVRHRSESANKSRSRRNSAGTTETTPSQRSRSSVAGSRPLSRRRVWIAAPLAAVTVVAIGLGYQLLSRPGRNPPSASPPTYVGGEACSGCHRAEAELWRGSQHHLAMHRATDQTVLGNFAGASFDYYGVHSRFFREDRKYLIETDGPDGNLATFEVKYAFGVDPLQQYL